MIYWSKLNQQQQSDALSRPELGDNRTVRQSVTRIIDSVAKDGDDALFKLTERFDRIRLDSLRISQTAIVNASNRLSDARKLAIQTAYSHIESFHRAQLTDDITIETAPGVTCMLKTEAIDSVGLYIPAGTAPLPSTVLMLGVPAKIAGCSRVVLVCPPQNNTLIADEILYAAKLCQIDEIYTIGGAQAIAALALGTETIKPVNKVFGPGNRYVTEAKTQLAQRVPGFTIDMPAGPSELLIIADQHATPSYVAADLLSQAEHGIDSQVMLVTDSESLAHAVTEQLASQLALLSRQQIADEALQQSRVIITDSLADAVAISNRYGPEHLSLQCRDTDRLLTSIRGAGSVFVGDFSPESAGDYASGTNHVLPTYGYSKVLSSLHLADFSRRYTVQTLTREGLRGLAPTIIELTDAEGLDAHQRAVTIRLEQTNATATQTVASVAPGEAK
ncbi:histidinol dehydrogenase [Thalassotalea ponticola]|uniref:histidinol dehydrogenase n=1 Tax=Thalassotalea ponticola TaxID=1523392 RepID=UPI0025B58502|nr:histidinol dehydrogenase [Thalassotalea ponticola]MDN3651300.1 histidinol dehydrogenase [Thalassotalea ponticola]